MVLYLYQSINMIGDCEEFNNSNSKSNFKTGKQNRITGLVKREKTKKDKVNMKYRLRDQKLKFN